MRHSPGSRSTRPSNDRLTGIALVASIGVALLLGLWLWPRATDWLPGDFGQPTLSRADGAVRPIPPFATPAPPTLAPAPTVARALPVDAEQAAARPVPASTPAWRGRATAPAALVAAPGADQVVDQLPAGALVLVRAEQPGPDGAAWYRARRPGGHEGWVSAGVIVPWTAPFAPAASPRRAAGAVPVGPTAASSTVAAGPMGADSVVNAPAGQGVQLRATPDPDGRPGPLVPNGTRVAILQFAVGPQGNAWARVQAGDATGWAPVHALEPAIR